jgi:hypothetical protein
VAGGCAAAGAAESPAKMAAPMSNRLNTDPPVWANASTADISVFYRNDASNAAVITAPLRFICTKIR